MVASILDCIAQPVWVADHDGLIRFANPSAVAALGYDNVSELLGKPSHQTIHYKRPDGSSFPAEECPLLLPRTTGETVYRADDWFVRRDGAMIPVEYWSAPIDGPAGRGAVVAFRDVGERRRTEDVLRERDAILSALGQPVYVSTPEGLITYANPAAVAVLGFGEAAELLGQNAHWLVHYKRRDGSRFPVEECPLARCRETGNAVRIEEDWLVRKDGSMLPVACTAVPYEAPGGYGIAVSCTDLTMRRAAEQAARDREVAEARTDELSFAEARHRAILAAALDGVIIIDQQGTVTYVNAAAERIFGCRADQVLGRELAGAFVPLSSREAHRRGLARYLATGKTHILDRRIEITATRADGSEFPAELTVTRAGLPGEPAFIGYVRDITERQRADQDLRIARERLKVIADEQAALRQVATLVARGAEPRAVFDAVCEATGRLIGAASVNLAQFTPDEANLTRAGWSQRGTHVPTGTRLPLGGDSINNLIRQTHAPARVDSYEGRSGQLAARLRELGIKSEVGAPVIVDGSVWGALIAGTDQAEPTPPGTERRVASFAELIGTAVSNATARSELIDSRARMVTAFDAARQRVTRDLHDGAQQQLLSTLINLQLAQQSWSSASPEAKEFLDLAIRDTRSSIDSLREIAAGIHPAILTHRGLAAALEALANRLPIPVHLDITDRKLPGPIEASTYFFCSEALTNVVKHAQASSAWVRVVVEDDRYTIEVRDDGTGGAEPRLETSGLIGLRDRIGALKGAMHISSPVSSGTTLRAWIPLSRETAAPQADGST
jgi:PAS domain S-box-containing protein